MAFAPAPASSSRRPPHFSTGSSADSALTHVHQRSASASRSSRINHGSHSPAPQFLSGDHHRKSSATLKTYASHEPRGSSRRSFLHTSSSRLMDPRILPSGQLLFYLRDPAEADHIVSQFREKLYGPLGFDIEYKPNFTKGSRPNKTALVQLASKHIVLLAQVSAMDKFPQAIRTIIEDPTIIKAGVGIKGDALKLWADFGISAAACLELANLARAVDSQWALWKGMIGLARLVKIYDDRDLKKPKHIQMSNWELFLTDEQQDYAAEDANAGLTVLQKLYAILPSVEPAPADANYLFRMSNGQAQTLSGATFPPPPLVL